MRPRLDSTTNLALLARCSAPEGLSIESLRSLWRYARSAQADKANLVFVAGARKDAGQQIHNHHTYYLVVRYNKKWTPSGGSFSCKEFKPTATANDTERNNAFHTPPRFSGASAVSVWLCGFLFVCFCAASASQCFNFSNCCRGSHRHA